MSIRAKTKRRVTILIVGAVLVLGGMAGYVVIKKTRYQAYLAKARAAGMEAARNGNNKLAVDKLTEYLGRHWDDLEALETYAQVRPKVEPNDPGTDQKEMQALRRILELDPSRSPERHQLLELYAKYRLWTETGDLASEILNPKRGGDPNDIKGLQYKTVALSQLRKFNEALVSAKQWAKLEPMNVKAQMEVVALMYDVKDPTAETPIDYAKNLRRQHPGLAEFELINGYACALGQEYDNAIQLLKLAAEKTPPKDGAPDNEFAGLLVTQLNEMFQYDESLAVLERLAKAKGNENNKDVIKALARRKWEMNRMPDVLELSKDIKINEPSADLELMMMRATALIGTGKRDEAETIRKAMEARTDDAVAQAWAMVLDPKRTGAPDQARRLVNACEKAVKQEPRNIYMRYQLGEAYAQIRENELAINEMQRVAIENATWYVPLVRLSALRLEDRNYTLAYDAAVEGEHRAPTNPVAAINLVKIWSAAIENGKVPDQTAPGKDLLSIAKTVQSQIPGEEETLTIIVSMLSKKGNKAEAVDWLRQALAKYPLSEATLMQLAQISKDYNLGMEEECFAKNEKARGLTPGLAYARALSLHFKGKTQDGLTLMRSAAEKSPNKTDFTWPLLIARYMDVTKNPAAKDEWMKVADAYPDNLAVQTAAMEARASRDDRAFMDKTIERVKSLTPGEGTRWRLARARWLTGSSNKTDWEQAVTLLKQVVEKASGLIEARFLYAQTLEKLGNVEGAIAQLKAATNLDPTNEGVGLYLARLYTGRGEFDQARQLLDRITKDSQANSDTKRQVALIYSSIGDSAKAMDTLKGMDIVDERSDLLMAMLYRQRNEIDKADALALKLLEKPDAVIVQFAADLFASEGKKDQAEKALAALDKLDLKPGFRELLKADYASRHVGQDEALKQFKAATAAAPSNAATWRSMIVYCIAIGRADEMSSVLDAAVKAVPNDKDLQALSSDKSLLANATGDAQLRALAVVYAQGSNEQSPARKAISIVLDGRSARHTPEQIAADLRKLADENLGAIEIQNLMARTYLFIGKYDEASTIALRAMDNFRNAPEPAMLAVDVLSAAGRWPEVLATARTWRDRSGSRTLGPDMAIAMAYMQLKQPHSATEVLQQYMNSAIGNPDMNVPVLMQYFAAMNQAGDTDKTAAMAWPWAQRSALWRQKWVQMCLNKDLPKATAIAWLEKLQAIIPAENVAERSLMGEAWNALGEYTHDPSLGTRAEQVLAPLMDKADTPTPAMIIMGVRNEVHGNFDGAEALYRRVLKVDPKQAVAANNLAMILARKDSQASWDEAMDLAKLAVQVTPNRGTIWDTLALIQEKKKMYTPALESMQQALRLEPDSAEWRVHKCEILIKASRKQEARQVVIEIEALPPAPLSADVQKRLEAVRTELNKEASKQAAIP